MLESSCRTAFRHEKKPPLNKNIRLFSLSNLGFSFVRMESKLESVLRLFKKCFKNFIRMLFQTCSLNRSVLHQLKRKFWRPCALYMNKTGS